jgi:hypothetical protein
VQLVYEAGEAVGALCRLLVAQLGGEVSVEQLGKVALQIVFVNPTKD